MVLKNKKKRKILRIINFGVGEDRISNLPDELIHHILSFVPTKCVLSTCILSKRWKYLSSSIPTLDFRCWQGLNCTTWPSFNCNTRRIEHLRTQQFMNFLDTVLYHHEKPKIQKFYLHWDCSHPFDGYRVTGWINLVIKRKVEELFLSEGSSFLFHLSFFTCDSLTVLDLERVRLNVPNTVCFPRLKLLRLRNMCVSMTELKIKKLISNSPILEELSFIHCTDRENSILCITSISLKKLGIYDCVYHKDSILKISAPNLSTISYKVKVLANLGIEDSCALPTEADIDMSLVLHNIGWEFCDKVSVLIMLFEKLSNIKLLTMSFACFLVPSEADILLLPAFNNLIHLEVSSKFFLPGAWLRFCFVMRRFFKFLQVMPNLESIVFALGIGIRIPEEADDGYWSSLDPICLPQHLKSIIFRCIVGDQRELNAIKLLLKYVGNLETVTVVAHHTLSKNHEKLINVKKLLLMIPRPANCLIKFLTSS